MQNCIRPENIFEEATERMVLYQRNFRTFFGPIYNFESVWAWAVLKPDCS